MIEWPDPEATVAFGSLLARALEPGLLITLEGPLGAGKTTLVRGVLRGLGHTGPVKSPTYNLVETYTTASHAVCHFDLYRLGTPEELEEMGFRDYLDGQAVIFIEWPERGAGVLPVPDLCITIEFAGPGRRVRLAPAGPAGVLLASKLS